MSTFDFAGAFLVIISVQLGWGLVIAIYRLYLHPLAKIPGPRLAASTFWYEFYYDVILPGRYVWKIKDLHERYGPFLSSVTFPSMDPF